jgi:hypothetical protein
MTSGIPYIAECLFEESADVNPRINRSGTEVNRSLNDSSNDYGGYAFEIYETVGCLGQWTPFCRAPNMSNQTGTADLAVLNCFVHCVDRGGRQRRIRKFPEEGCIDVWVQKSASLIFG